METQTEDPLCRIVDLVSATMRLSGPRERRKLQLALSIFMQCTDMCPSLDPNTIEELKEQIEWIYLYRKHQDRYPTYRIPLDNSLVPITEDVHYLMPRFANEVISGARTIATLLHVPLKRAREDEEETDERNYEAELTEGSDKCDSEVEFTGDGPEIDPTESSEEGSDCDVHGTALEYSYAYF